MTYPPLQPVAGPDHPEHVRDASSPPPSRPARQPPDDGGRRARPSAAPSCSAVPATPSRRILGGGGPQPEDVLPADTVAFAKLDLDPAMNQKAAVFSLLEKFPEVETRRRRPRRHAVRRAAGTRCRTASTSTTTSEPWLGDRMAVAAVPAPDSDAGVAPVLVLAVTDEQAMTDTLGGVHDADFGFAVRDDFVLVTDTQENADRLAAGETSLADEDGTSTTSTRWTATRSPSCGPTSPPSRMLVGPAARAQRRPARRPGADRQRDRRRPRRVRCPRARRLSPTAGRRGTARSPASSRPG